MQTRNKHVELVEVVRDNDTGEGLGDGIDSQNRPEDRPIWTIAFGISLIALFILSAIINGVLAFALPIAFIPTIMFFLWWYCGASRNLVGFHSLVFAYATAFYVGSVLVTVYENLVGVSLAIFFGSALKSEKGFLTVYFFYVLLAESLGSEVMKLAIAQRGRKNRSDLTNVSAYLMYSTSAALGFVTFLTVLQNFIATSVKHSVQIYDDYPLLLIRALVGIPLHAATGYFIGIFVAKREVYQWKTSASRILAFPVFIRTLVEYVFVICWYKPSFLTAHNKHYPAFLPGLITAVVALLALLLVIRVHKKDLPSSFGLLSNEEDGNAPVPDVFDDFDHELDDSMQESQQ